MTDKEKAKAYDRAIEVMRQWIAPCHDKKQLEVMKCSVFPELRESEDERIRKYLIEELKAAKSVGELKFIIPQPTREECIAYLEKQKESTWTDEDESFVKHILPRILNPDKWTMDQVEGDRERLKEFIDRQKCKWLEKHKDNKSAPRVLPCSAAWFEDGEEEQKEQKPAEWNANDKAFIKDCAHILDKYGYGACARRLLSMFPVKPADWSEEDKTRLNNIIWAIHMKSLSPLDEMDDRDKYKGYENFLKSLPERFNLQPKQEWSEEDELMRTAVIQTLERFVGYRGTVGMQIDWLKSLRPSWKPSEEQMEALKKSGKQTCKD